MEKTGEEALGLWDKKKEYCPFGFFFAFCTTVAECGIQLMLKWNVQCEGTGLPLK